MRVSYYFSFLIFVSSNSFSQGIIFDSATFYKEQVFTFDRGILPDKVSLEKYLPYLYPQTGGTCVAMSFAMARTIQYASSNQITDIDKITALSFSPYFVYYAARAKTDLSCEKGLNPIVAAEVAKKYGFTRMKRIEYPSYYPFTANTLCPNSVDFIPPDYLDHLKEAAKFKISEVYVTSSIDGIKAALAKKIPVILAMKIPKSFEVLKGPVWAPLKNEFKFQGSGHAIVAIGYDDDVYNGAIRIVNSWGDKWGDNGKAWIRYKDLPYWLDGALLMTISSEFYQSKIAEDSNMKKGSNLNEQTLRVKPLSDTIEFNNRKVIGAFEGN